MARDLVVQNGLQAPIRSKESASKRAVSLISFSESRSKKCLAITGRTATGLLTLVLDTGGAGTVGLSRRRSTDWTISWQQHLNSQGHLKLLRTKI